MVTSGKKFTDLIDGIISKLRKASGYKGNKQNSLIFLCTSNTNGNEIYNYLENNYKQNT